MEKRVGRLVDLSFGANGETAEKSVFIAGNHRRDGTRKRPTQLGKSCATGCDGAGCFHSRTTRAMLRTPVLWKLREENVRGGGAVQLDSRALAAARGGVEELHAVWGGGVVLLEGASAKTLAIAPDRMPPLAPLALLAPLAPPRRSTCEPIRAKLSHYPPRRCPPLSCGLGVSSTGTVLHSAWGRGDKPIQCP